MFKRNSKQSPVEETQYVDGPLQLTRVFEVFEKDDDMPDGKDGKCEVLLGSSQRHSIQGDSIDLEVALNSDIVTIEDCATRVQGAEAACFKIADLANSTDENMVILQQTVSERTTTKTAQVVDKDDPRSRMHFVKYHKRDGKTLKVWECGICTKEFRHQYTLMRHLPTHTDERNFKCDACGKAFRQLSTLSQHKAIHSDARPYVCEFCKKTFNRVSTLISHRKTHSEHKPHKCHLCGKGFHQKGNLRNHVFTHTNERPYKCEICQKGFNQMSNLVCHKVKAHAHAEKMQYSCGICGEDFPRRFALRSHEESKHGIKYRQTGQTSNNEATVNKSKNMRIVDLEEPEDNTVMDSKDKDDGMTEFMENIIIDKIETKAMETALLQNQIPFALFKPAKGIPVLVKVTPSGSMNHLLTPATPDDLKMSGKMEGSPSVSLQIKVPVVAVITERIDLEGKISFEIEPPGPDQEQDNLISTLDAVSPFPELLQNDMEEEPKQPTRDQLFNLADQGGIQFVRATEDGGYEVMSTSEARNLMSMRNHDVTILDGEEAEAILLKRNNPAPTALSAISDMMVPDATEMSLEDMSSILTEKDIKIINPKSLDDRLLESLNYLSHTKIDDILVESKALGIDAGLSVMDNDDSGIGISSSASMIYTNPDDMSMLVDEVPTSMDSRQIPDYSNLSGFEGCEIAGPTIPPAPFSFEQYAAMNPFNGAPYGGLPEYSSLANERMVAKKLESEILAAIEAGDVEAIELELHDERKPMSNPPTYHDMVPQQYNMGVAAVSPLDLEKMKHDTDNYLLQACSSYGSDYLFDNRLTNDELGNASHNFTTTSL